MLFAYALAILRPALPVLSDAIAHLSDEAAHIASVHYENGKYHVHKELRKSAEKSKEKSTFQNAHDVFQHFPVAEARLDYQSQSFKSHSFLYHQHLSDFLLQINLPPPRIG
jgi:hypothetical protein